MARQQDDTKALTATAMLFHQHINARDLTALAGMMNEGHVFVDSAGNAVRGKTACINAWEGFFRMFPDYRNVVEHSRVMDGRVVMLGHSGCSDPRLNGPAIWVARVDAGAVTEWRVYEDTLENRRVLGWENE